MNLKTFSKIILIIIGLVGAIVFSLGLGFIGKNYGQNIAKKTIDPVHHPCRCTVTEVDSCECIREYIRKKNKYSKIGLVTGICIGVVGVGSTVLLVHKGFNSFKLRS